MRAVVSVVVVVAGFALSVPLASASQHCQPSGSTTLASDSFARVYGKSGSAFVCVKATGATTRLKGASPSSDKFALGGEWVAYSSGPTHSLVNVMHIPNHGIPSTSPFDTGDRVNKVVVKSDGAAAWAATPQPAGSGPTYVEGFDRRNHEADTFSDDTKNVVGRSLTSLAGHAISWRYADGSTGTANLF